MAETTDPIQALAAVLTEHGPLHTDEIAQRLREVGIADPDAVAKPAFMERRCPVTQLVDDRWVWLPSPLAERVFTHRLTADEADDDIVTATPDLGPIAALCHHAEYQRLADGSSVLDVARDRRRWRVDPPR